MPAAEPFIEFLIDQFSPLGAITSRYMFGGYVLYCDGFVFALIASGAVFLKADDANRGRFEERGLQAFRPFEDKDAVMPYYQAPPEIFEDADAMKSWVGSAVAASRRAKEKKPARKAAKTTAKRGSK